MITATLIQSNILELKTITKIDLCILDVTGGVIATTTSDFLIGADVVDQFVNSIADSQTIGGDHFIKVSDDNEVHYVIVARGDNDNALMIAKVFAIQMKNLITIHKKKYDKNVFFQNLILDNLLLVDIYNRARELSVPIEAKWLVFLIELSENKESDAMETLKNLFPSQNGNYITAVDDKNIALVKNVELSDSYEEANVVATTIVDMMSAEAMIKTRVSYGNIVTELKEVSKSYKEARLALEVSKIFYADRSVVTYGELGIGRLIYQLPTSLCKMFIREVFDSNNIPKDLDEEILTTIDQFFENNLNVSETSRRLFIHRNTLVYRIEKLQKATGLDIRVFEDALTLKIALMVGDYLDYLEKN